MDTKVKCTRITRVVGYARPIDHWNKGKKREWNARQIIGQSNGPGDAHSKRTLQ